MRKISKEILGNIGQIFLLFLFLPFLCIIVKGEKINEILVDILGEIKYFKAIINVVASFVQLNNSALIGNSNAYLDHVFSVIDALDTSLFQLLDVSICVAFCNMLWDIWKKVDKVRGGHILSSVAGVLIGYAVVVLFDIPIIISLFLIVLYVVVDIIFVQEVKFSIVELLTKYLRASLKFCFVMVESLFLTCGIAVVLVIWQSNFTDIGMIIFMLCLFFVPCILIILIETYVFWKK